jgi:hypothetical protein
LSLVDFTSIFYIYSEETTEDLIMTCSKTTFTKGLVGCVKDSSDWLFSRQSYQLFSKAAFGILAIIAGVYIMFEVILLVGFAKIHLLALPISTESVSWLYYYSPEVNKDMDRVVFEGFSCVVVFCWICVLGLYLAIIANKICSKGAKIIENESSAV